MASDRRQDAATALTGAGALAAGGKLRHVGVARAVQGKAYPKVHLAAIVKPRAHGRYLYAGGTLLGLAGTAATAQGVSGLVRRETSKRDKRPLWQEGVAGTADALKGRSESLRTKQPADLRASQAAIGAGAGGLGAFAARMALHKTPALKPWLAPVAGGLAATASLPVSSAVVRRRHPDYQVTPTGVRRKKDLIPKPSTKTFQSRRQPRSLTIDVGKAQDYLGSRTSYRTQRAAVTGAGGVPVIGPLAQARQAARYAPPGQERKTAVRQLAYGPGASTAAGVGAAYGAASLAGASAKVGAHAEKLVAARAKATNSLRRSVGLKNTPPRGPAAAGTARHVLENHPALKPLFRTKGRTAAATVGFLGAKSVAGLVGGQRAISDSQKEQATYNARHHITKADVPNPGTKREQHKLARAKRTNAALSTLGGATGLTGLALLPTRHKAAAVYTSTVGGGIGGLNALLGAKVQRKEAKRIDPVAKSLPTHAVHASFGKVRVLSQHSKDHFMVLTNRDERRLLHRDALRFTNKGELGKRDDLAITGSRSEHKALIHQYGDRGPLPKGLDRDTKMRAYEARYVHAGGDKSQKWNRRANAAEGSRNAALATGTAGLAGLAALKHPKIARRLAKHPRLAHRIDATALTAGAVGGASELYGEYARHRRASYANSPGGVAASALRRMRAYTPQD